MPEIPESMVSATVSMTVDSVTTTFSSSIGGKAGQESRMLDIAWRQAMKQFNEELDGAENKEKT